MITANADVSKQLTEFGDAVRADYGARLARLVIFGSQARGDFTAGSDCDLAVFLHDLVDRQFEIGRLLEIERRVFRDSGPILDVVVLPASAWNERTTFMHEVRREGREL